MKISERTIKRLGQIITGDALLSPYRSGPKLVNFFNDLGLNDNYPSGGGFPSRWSYAESCIREFNGKPELKKVILSAFDPRDYMGAQVYDPAKQEHRSADLQAAVKYVNEFLAFDGFEIVSQGAGFNIIDKTTGEISLDVTVETDHLSLAFILEQIEKSRLKIGQGDYDGAITNARSLVEAVLSAVEKEFDQSPPGYDGNLPKLYRRVQVHLNLTPDSQKISDNLKQVLSGLSNIIHGLSGLSNVMGDRHVREYKPSKHHAVLLVNSAMTFCSFIFDTYSYQRERNKAAA